MNTFWESFSPWLFGALDVVALLGLAFYLLVLLARTVTQGDPKSPDTRVRSALWAFSLFAGWHLAYFWAIGHLFLHIALTVVIAAGCYVLCLPLKRVLASPDQSNKIILAASVLIVNTLVAVPVLMAIYLPPFNTNAGASAAQWTLGPALPWLRLATSITVGIALVAWSFDYLGKISQRYGNGLYASFLVLVIVSWATLAIITHKQPAVVGMDVIARQLQSGVVTKVVVSDSSITIMTQTGEEFTAYKESGVNAVELLRSLGLSDQQLATVPLEVRRPTFVDQLLTSLPTIAAVAAGGLIAALLAGTIISRNLPGARGNDLSFSKSRHRFISSDRPMVTFDDIGGIPEAKQSLQEIVSFLTSPQSVAELGATPPRGVLLEGPPGTGKTLLARAVAGQAEVAMFVVNGSEFTELFVGIGASRIRDVFAAAKKEAPCVIFIDELDAIGHRRENAAVHSAELEYHQTLNQLLAELDGFEPRTSVVVIAATNRADILDPALVRAGRFDRRVKVPLPDAEARLQILKIHLHGKVLAPDVDLDELTQYTAGMTGADLATLVNEATLTAVRQGERKITRSYLFEATKKLGTVIPEMQRAAEIKKALDGSVVGQEPAKKALALAVSEHYSRIRATVESSPVGVAKPSVLLHGPSGTGKTLMVKTLASVLQVPFAMLDAGSLSQGTDGVRLMIHRLLASGRHDQHRAEHGIVCIYGLESLVAETSTLDQPTRRRVQNDLVRLIEGTTVEVPRQRYASSTDSLEVDTSRLLFIFEGTLTGLDLIVEKRLGSGASGNGPSNPLHLATVQDLVQYGVAPALAERLSIVAATDALSEDELLRILKEPKDSVIEQYQKRFAGIGVKLVVDPGGMQEVVREALRRDGGARALMGIMEEVLFDAFYDHRQADGALVVDAAYASRELTKRSQT